MAESIASELVGRLMGYLSQLAVEKFVSYLGGRNKLNKLKHTMEMIQARLVDAERRREDEDGALVKLWMTRLKLVLYKLEDLFEEIYMDDKEEERMDEGGKLFKLVRMMNLQFRGLQMNKRVSRDFKAIMKELEDVTSDMAKLNFRECSIEKHGALNLICKRPETHSFIIEEEVIGREEDKRTIVKMLLNTSYDGEGNVSVIPIIGIGGIGKTTLAQICYNDRSVEQHFELKGWACVSEASSLEEIGSNILRSFSSLACEKLNMQELQSRIRDAVNDKRYLLVLDDVWDENRERWLHLRRLLSGGKRGSKIIVTSRLRIVALNMGTVEAYELRGLEEEKSWDLFKSLAFKEGQEETNPSLTNIGREVVKKCANVPLAIRTVSGLLYSKDTEQEWIYFEDCELSKIEQHENGGNDIMSTLRLSYDHLPSHLKQCFAYCSLFPKDYKFDKQQLIWLWMAQGFLRPLGNQSPEDLGHGYFMELLRRCFFQDVQRNKLGMIKGCKMHDLLHDLACEVGDECLKVVGCEEHMKYTIRHLSFDDFSMYSSVPSWLLVCKHIKSLVFLRISNYNLDKLCSSLRCLRTLDVTDSVVSLPNSIGELKQLRYLKLKVSSISLPDSITSLQYLQVLDLRGSCNITELPIGFSKMSSLRHLLTGDGIQLIDMPPRFGELSSLKTLDIFVVGKNNGLDAVGSMSLAGMLSIYFREHRQNVTSEAMISNLKGKKLTSLVFDWSVLGDEAGADADEELDCLQPPASLEDLCTRGWKGVNFSGWGMSEFPCLLPNLVYVEISDCRNCLYLPPWSRLPHLRSLVLRSLDALEYVENGCEPSNVSRTIASSSANAAAAYFPSLKKLRLLYLPRLKGWSRMEDDQSHHQQFHFPGLSKLKLHKCPNMMSMPGVPKLEFLEAIEIPWKLLNQLLMTEEVATEAALSSPSSSSLSSSLSHLSKLRLLKIWLVEGLQSLSLDLPTLESLTILSCNELMRVTAISSVTTIPLRRLEIKWCDGLKYITSALMQFPTLEELEIWECKELDMWDFKGVSCLTMLQTLRIGGIPNFTSLPEFIGYLSQLHFLHIEDCPNLASLSNAFGSLTQLRYLCIWRCPKLTSLPDSFCNLTALQVLWISQCPDLTTRCKQPHGEDWPLIKHVPRCSLF